jgi:hypothetical protein
MLKVHYFILRNFNRFPYFITETISRIFIFIIPLTTVQHIVVIYNFYSCVLSFFFVVDAYIELLVIILVSGA